MATKKNVISAEDIKGYENLKKIIQENKEKGIRVPEHHTESEQKQEDAQVVPIKRGRGRPPKPKPPEIKDIRDFARGGDGTGMNPAPPKNRTKDGKRKDNPTGRGHKIELDRDDFERLCSEFCTLEEIAGYFNCSTDAVQAWCKRTYMMTFTEAFNIFNSNGRISLRRAQFRAALGGNATLLIWLGKNFLGQSEDGLVSKDNEKGMQIMQSLLELRKENLKDDKDIKDTDEEGDDNGED